ncbi:MAG TPA: Hsp20/alpha crystallin family protein [Gemmatimonadaceae bacterium]
MATNKGPGTQEKQAGGAQPQATQAQPQGTAAQQPTAPAQQGAPTQATTAMAPREDRGLARGGLPMFGPFSLMRRLFDDMEQLWGGAGREPLEQALAPFVPAVDVDRRGDRIIVRVDLPGMAADDVTVTITDNALIVEGERRVEARERGVYERAYGSFRRAIPLPENTEAESAEARFENGVLEISVRAPERRERGRNVQINKPGEQARTSREAH